MRIFVNILIVTFIYVASGRLIQAPTPRVNLANFYEIHAPDRYEDYVLGGHSPGIGSGLTLISEKNDSEKEFLSIADNGSYLINRQGDKIPFVGKITLADEKAAITAVIPLTGLSETFDGEGLALETGAIVWLADEGQPSIFRYNLSLGRALGRYAPGSGLPEVLSKQMYNRGPEGLAVMPGGKVLFAMQSILDAGEDSLEVARHIRILRVDPTTQKTETFLYPIDTELYAPSSEVKLGGLTAINSHRALVLEQGPLKAGGFSNRVVEVDFLFAEEVEDSTAEVERTGDDQGYRALQPKEIFNLRDYGWVHRKAEGIALTEQGRTIYIVNDIDTKGSDGEETELDPFKVYLWEFRMSRSFKLHMLADLGYRLAPGLLALVAMMLLFKRGLSRKRR